MSKKGIIAIIGVLVIVSAVGATIVYKNKKKNESNTKYRTSKIERGDISTLVTATGTINAVTTVQVGSQVSGTIAKLYADFNSVVRRGEVVAQIDTTFLSAQVANAQANLEKARVTVDQAKRDYDRAIILFQKDFISQADRDQAQTTYQSSVAQLKQNQAALASVVTNLKYATIRAPIDGVVISRDVDVGQTVAASLQAPKLFSIANDLTKMRLETSVDEADIGKVSVGQTATFTVDAYPEEEFEGTVSQIRLEPITTQSVVTYTTIIDVSNPERKLMPGMTANVSIMVAYADDVLKVANAALRFRPPVTQSKDQKKGEGQARERGASYDPDQPRQRLASERQGDTRPQLNRPSMMGRNQWRNKPKVWILASNGIPKPIMVETGITDGSFTEVTKGDLKEGQEVIVGTEISTPTSQMAPFGIRAPQRGGGGPR